MLLPGTAGEHLVCADLMLSGYPAFLTSAGLHYDVVAEVGGRMLRVAVKSTLKSRPLSRAPDTHPRYQFNITHRAQGRVMRGYGADLVDLVALVGLDRRHIAYIPASECPTIMHLRDPDVVPAKPSRKGPTPGMRARNFDDFPLNRALETLQ